MIHSAHASRYHWRAEVSDDGPPRPRGVAVLARLRRPRPRRAGAVARATMRRAQRGERAAGTGTCLRLRGDGPGKRRRRATGCRRRLEGQSHGRPRRHRRPRRPPGHRGRPRDPALRYHPRNSAAVASTRRARRTRIAAPRWPGSVHVRGDDRRGEDGREAARNQARPRLEAPNTPSETPSHDRPEDRDPALEPGGDLARDARGGAAGRPPRLRPSLDVGPPVRDLRRPVPADLRGLVAARRLGDGDRADAPRPARRREHRSAIPGSSPRPPRRSTTSATAGRSSASAARGWSSSTRPTASTSGSGFGQRLDWLDESVGAMRAVLDGGSATSEPRRRTTRSTTCATSRCPSRSACRS